MLKWALIFLAISVVAGFLGFSGSPLEIKGSVVGYGRATKSQVQMMVNSLLRLGDSVRSFDASDALAVALCHAVAQVTKSKLVSRRAADA